MILYFFFVHNQLQKASCITPENIKSDIFEEVCEEIHPNMAIQTMFSMPFLFAYLIIFNIILTLILYTQPGIDVQTINCKNTIQGCYHFTYEVDYGGGSICDSPQSTITACQKPGSVYVDNQVFEMSFGECPDVAGSTRTSGFVHIIDWNKFFIRQSLLIALSTNSKHNQHEHLTIHWFLDQRYCKLPDIRFQCMGTWEDLDGNIFSALANIGAVHYRDRFRCMVIPSS